MGSTINIGLVYSNLKLLGDKLFKLLGLLDRNHSHYQSVKFSEDINGESWIEIEHPNMDIALVEMMTKMHFVQITSFVDLFQLKRIETVIRIEKNDEYFGILLMFNENEILPNYSIESLERITHSIISFIEESYPLLEFDYAICDHEAEIEFSPNDFKPERYSLSFLPDLSKGRLDVIKSSWHINGLTERQ